MGKGYCLLTQIHNGDLTTCLGYRNPDELEKTIGTVLDKVIKDIPLEENGAILHHSEGIDCRPSLSMITLNALACSDSVIIPVQAHYLSAKRNDTANSNDK